MVKQHLKRLASPRTWPIPKKTLTFVARPRPGPHKLDHQIPLSVFLRDMIGVVDTKKEAKYILHNKDCLVDQKIIHSERRPVGLLDVISLKKTNEHYLILINKNNNLYAVKIGEKEAGQKISKLKNKSTLKGGKTQLNTFDGRSIIVDDATKYTVGDSLVLELPSQKIIDTFEMKKGAPIFLDAGRHVGAVGNVDAINGTDIVVKTDTGVFKTKRKYAIVIGKDKPVITI